MRSDQQVCVLSLPNPRVRNKLHLARPMVWKQALYVQSTNIHNGMAMLLQRRGQMWPRCVSVQHVAQLDKLVLTINSQAFPDVTCGEILREINIILHRL